MDSINYPRNLNRPTYLFWRFTHKDVAAIFIGFGLLMMPAGFWDDYPAVYALCVGFVYVLYRGAIVALKPRGWEEHKLSGWFEEKQLNPGHSFHRCFIVPELAASPLGFYGRLKARFREMQRGN